MTSPTIEFFGGLGVIGSSKILITDGHHRVLLDVGVDIPAGGDLFRPPVTMRPGRELADRLRVAAAPHIPGLFDPAALADGDPLAAAWPGVTEVFLSHPHIDHVGLAGFVRPELPVHAHRDAVAVLRALSGAGAGLAGGDPDWRELAAGEHTAVGGMDVQCVRVDHDVPGACGYLVHTTAGTLAYTGDIRFHGRHRHRADAFVDGARGAAVLVTEGTTLGLDIPAGPPRTEDDVAASFGQSLAATEDLVLLAVYPRDVERVAQLAAVAAAADRRLVFPAQAAAVLRALGVGAIATIGVDVSAADLADSPGAYVVQPAHTDLPGLLDLPIGPGTVLVHANGEPLGDFDTRWGVFVDWLAALGIPLVRAGCSGHAMPADLHAMVERIAPDVVFPIHTTAPGRLLVPAGVRRVIARYGARYDLAGNPLD